MTPEPEEEYKDFVRRVAAGTKRKYLEAQAFIKHNGLWRPEKTIYTRKAPACVKPASSKAEEKTVEIMDGRLMKAILADGEIPIGTPLCDAMKLGHNLSSRVSKCKNEATKEDFVKKHRAVWDAIKKYKKQLKTNMTANVEAEVSKRMKASEKIFEKLEEQISGISDAAKDLARTAVEMYCRGEEAPREYLDESSSSSSSDSGSESDD